MAVPFYVPNEDDQRENGSSSQPHSTTTSAMQTPLQSPIVYNEHLVQVFYEALSLYSADQVLRTPCSTSPPSSPSCCFPHSNRGDVFFSPLNVLPRTPASYGRYQQWRMQRNSNEVQRRRLNSSGVEDEAEEDEDVYADVGTDDCPTATNSNNNIPASPLPMNFNLEEHYMNLAARERLQEFPGQVPQKKKKVVNEDNTEPKAVKTEQKPKSKEQKFVWPTVVAAVVLAVGYVSSR